VANSPVSSHVADRRWFTLLVLPHYVRRRREAKNKESIRRYDIAELVERSL